MRKIVMPSAGKFGGPVTLLKWLKGQGERVGQGELIAQAEGVEGLVELEAAQGGVLSRILVAAGKTVPVGTEIAEYEDGAAGETVTKVTNPSGTAVPVLMPQVGNSMEEGTLVRWMVKEGDRIKVGQAIFEIETDKATVEVEATEAGRLARIVAGPGSVVPIKQPVGYLAENDADVAGLGSAPAPVAAANGHVASPAPQPAEGAALPADAVPVLMPQVGNSMEEGTIVRWMVKEGDRIKVGQEIFEIETDKATVPVEATQAGRLAAIVAGPGAVVPIKQPVAYLSESEVKVGKVAATVVPAAAKAAPAATPGAAAQPVNVTASANPVGAQAALTHSGPVTAGGPVKASPHARKLARESGLDLASVPGSGPGGRILSTDLDHARPAARGAGAQPASEKARPGIAPVTALAATEVVRRKMSKMRKAIGANLQMSKQTVPHFYLRGTIDAGPLMSFYRAEKAKYPCSVNDVVALACAKAIIEFPALRSKIDKDEIVEYPHVNIGVAVGVEDGLTVPVLLNAHAMTLQQIAAGVRRIVENARAGKLEGFGHGNFTISNLGMFGTEEFAAIVNPPEPGILAVGAVREDVIVKDGAMRVGKVMTMTLSCDHRVVDGLLAARFMARLKELLENPEVLL